MLALSRSSRLSRHNICLQCKYILKNTQKNGNSIKINFSSTTRPPTKRAPTKEQQKDAMEGLKSDIAEIGNILNKSSKTEDLRKSVPWSTFIKNTISMSKKEILNIATSFVCLVLAFQVMSQQLLSRKLKIENDGLIEERDRLLDNATFMQSEDFLNRVVGRCLNVIEEQRYSNSNHASYNAASSWGGWLFGFRKTNSTQSLSSVTEEEIILRSILHEEIKKVVSSNDDDINDDDGTILITAMLESLQSEGLVDNGDQDVLKVADNNSNDIDCKSSEVIEIESHDGKKIQRSRKFMM